MLSSLRLLVLCLLLPLAVFAIATGDGVGDYAEKPLFDWVAKKGGEIHVYAGGNKDGIRSLFAKRDALAGETLAIIPRSIIIDVGPLDAPIEVNILAFLKEMKKNCSELRPYFESLPKPHEVLNVCNFHVGYASLWNSEHWESLHLQYYDYLNFIFENPGRKLPSGRVPINRGKDSAHIDEDDDRVDVGSDGFPLLRTLKEAIGDTPVSLKDIRHTCGLLYSRAVQSPIQRRLTVVPVFDLLNHRRDCPHTVAVESDGSWQIVAGTDVRRGDELCYMYGDMRDDEAVSMYGFLPPVEHPPRLALVDHHLFVRDARFAAHELLPNFESDDMDAISHEVDRLQERLAFLRDSPSLVPPPPLLPPLPPVTPPPPLSESVSYNSAATKEKESGPGVSDCRPIPSAVSTEYEEALSLNSQYSLLKELKRRRKEAIAVEINRLVDLMIEIHDSKNLEEKNQNDQRVAQGVHLNGSASELDLDLDFQSDEPGETDAQSEYSDARSDQHGAGRSKVEL